MKTVLLSLVAFVIIIAAGRLWAPMVLEQSVQAAANSLSHTERELRSAVLTTATKARGLRNRLASSDPTTALPKDVEEFLATTQRLETLRGELQDDIENLAEASRRTLNAFDQERAAITDPITRHAMNSLRSQAHQNTAARLGQARASLDLLSRVLIQGSDVAHAARCVQLAEELNARGQDLEERITAAAAQANRYTKMTNDLLGRLTTAYTD